jgi:hypothetical protein
LPRANAVVERSVRSVNERDSQKVLGEYVGYFNGARIVRSGVAHPARRRHLRLVGVLKV